MTVVVLAAFGAGCGLVGVVWGLRSRQQLVDTAVGDERARSGSAGGALESVRGSMPPPLRLVLIAGTGLLVALLTRWPVGGLLAAAAAAGLPVLWASSETSRAADRYEALATWTEMLRDTLHASVGLSQAMVATAPVAPVAIRPAVCSLADRLAAGVPMVAALRLLAEDLHDSGADVVVCALILAASARSQRLADLLGSLAASTRENVAVALRIDAQRASTRSGIRIVVAFSCAFIAILAIVAHSYLSPFSSATGQLVLLMVGALDGLGVWLFARMTRAVDPPRLLGAAATGSASRPGDRSEPAAGRRRVVGARQMTAPRTGSR